MLTVHRFHDATSDAGAVIATLCVAITACIFTAEVVARYFLSAPLNWSGDVSSYLLCVTAFTALPAVTRANGHVAIGYLVEQFGEPARNRYSRAIQVVTGLVCLSTAVYIAIEGARLFDQQILTTQPTRIPKWPIALVACLGLGSSAVHLFRAPNDTAREEAAV